MVAGHLQVKRGIYQIVLNYIGEDGKRKTKWKSTGLPEKGNKKKAQDLLLEERMKFIPPDQSTDGNQLFADYLLKWLYTKQNTVSVATYASYCSNIKKVIYPYFKAKGLRLNELKHHHIKEFYDHELHKGKKATSIKRLHANIHAALKQAVKLEYIPSNQSELVELPKVKKFEAHFLDTAQCNALYAAAKGTQYEMPVVFGITYGLRRSELVGLKWDAIDFVNDRIHIRHTVTEVELDGRLQLIKQDTTKNQSSNRILPLIPKVKQWLIDLHARQLENRHWAGSSYCQEFREYIFVDDLGFLIKPNWISVNFGNFAKRAGIKNLRYHDLRHTCASLLLRAGASIKAIQEYMGHSDFSTTFNLYAHLDYADKVTAANALIRRLGMTDLIEQPKLTSPAFEGFMSDVKIAEGAEFEFPVN